MVEGNINCPFGRGVIPIMANSQEELRDLSPEEEAFRVRVTRAMLRLDDWFETMRQPEGYGGPVVHWWRHSLRYTGAAVDWRYEGILAGYARLAQSQNEWRWRDRLSRAMEDVRRSQTPEGSYRASRFEQNPGTHGTPHEAAASLGLLLALRSGRDDDWVRDVVGRNVDHLIAMYWDDGRKTFNDHPTQVGFVPNKLATLAETLIEWGMLVENEDYWVKAKAALDTVLRYQVNEGQWIGAVHQYAPKGQEGDGRFFPYYNARCVPALLKAAQVFSNPAYREAAEAILGFLDKSMLVNGSWPQVVYASGQVADGPRWVAGSADVLRAYWLSGRKVPERSFLRLLHGQMLSGAFSVAEGFAGFRVVPAWYDVMPVTGWNDKVLRFFAEWLGDRPLPVREPQKMETVDGAVRIAGRQQARWVETPKKCELLARDGTPLYRWQKSEPWAWVDSPLIAEG